MMLKQTERLALEKIASNGNERLTRRADIILLSAAGLPSEEIAGQLDVSERTVRRWQKAFAEKGLGIFPASALPEADEVSTLAAPPAENKQIGLAPDDSVAEAGRKILAYHFERMTRQEAGTYIGENPEPLHQMRVATRRMRACLKLLKGVYTKKAYKRLNGGLRATGRALGQVRDLDVFLEKIDAYQAEHPEADLTLLRQTWTAKRAEARQDLLAYLDSVAYVEFKKAMTAFINTPGKGVWARKRARRPVRAVVPGWVNSRYEAVLAYDELVPTAPMETLHSLRLTFKSLRYTLEYFRELLGAESKQVINQIKGMQDYLGDLNDAQVATEILCDFLVEAEDVQQAGAALAERQNPASIAVYLQAKLDERHRLTVNFPDLWATFKADAFQQQLEAALAPLA